MIKINLLPFRKAKRLENLRMQISVFILSIIIVGGVIGFSWVQINSEFKVVKDKHNSLNSELKSYDKILKKIAKLKKDRKDLQVKLDVIRGLEAQKAGPVQLFDEICLAVPEGKLFLKSLGESASAVNMSGLATDYDTVALFMDNLEKTKTITSVKLGGTSQAGQGGRTVCSFSLVCKRKVDNVPKAGKKKGGKKRRR